ncbi:hypothetical protein A1D31_22950 [Bradyrhizobium liaoningense]|nr:hypothetical protein A1D31_22950 [Bradyrhizobium liaoningense]
MLANKRQSLAEPSRPGTWPSIDLQDPSNKDRRADILTAFTHRLFFSPRRDFLTLDIKGINATVWRDDDAR